MDKNAGTTETIDDYIAGFPPQVRKILARLRQTIKEAAPNANERISYRMPAFEQNGPLVYFAAFKRHIGFYPTAVGIDAFKDKLAGYKSSKGAVQFPIDEDLPYSLIAEIVRFKAEENGKKVVEKKKKK